MRFLVVLSSIFLVSQSILNGHADEWNKYAHLVKILARASPESPALACSGTLISTGLVLTGADCVMQGGKKVQQIMVMVARADKAALRKKATIAQVNGTLAYLRLAHPLGTEEACPGFISSDLRVTRLPIVPSLTRSPITPFDWDKIGTTTCRILAFESMKNVDDFLTSSIVQTAVMKVEVEKDGLIVRRLDTGVPAPCFEDAGAPFECLVGSQFIQVGVFSSLYSADDGKEHRFKRDDKEVKDDSTTTTTTTVTTNAPKKEEAKGDTTTTPVPTNAPKKGDEKTDTTTTPVPTNVPKKDDEKADTTTTPEPTNAPKKEDKETFSRCLNASTLRFSRLDIVSVASFIEKYDFSGFVKMHEDCGLLQ